jgi:hypothetical protein
MYTEELRMPTKAKILLALPFAVVVVALAVLLIVLPIPLTARLAIFGALLIEGATGALLATMFSRIRITIDGHALTVAYRLLFTKRIALERIARCTPTDARIWGMSRHYPGSRYHGHAGPRRSVMLGLTNDVQILVTSRQPDAMCAALRIQRPAIG